MTSDKRGDSGGRKGNGEGSGVSSDDEGGKTKTGGTGRFSGGLGDLRQC